MMMSGRKGLGKIFTTSLSSNRGRRFPFKQTSEFNRSFSEIPPTKLTNHSSHTNINLYYKASGLTCKKSRVPVMMMFNMLMMTIIMAEKVIIMIMILKL